MKSESTSTFRIIKPVFLVMMIIFFGLQLSICIRKYLEFKVIEDIFEEQAMERTLPPITLCITPQWKIEVDPYTVTDIDQLCPNTTDYKTCFDDITFSQQDLILHINDFDIADKSTIMEYVKPAGRNIFHSQCFTYHNPVLRKAIGTDGIMFLLNSKAFNQKNGVIATVHNEGYYLQNFIISDPPQRFSSHFASPFKFTMMTIKSQKFINLNRKEKQCIVDQDYNIESCVEGYVRRKIGCSSPWDAFPDKTTKVCQSKTEFSDLFFLHKELHHLGSALLQNITGCLLPCEYKDFTILETHWTLGLHLDIPDPTGFLINYQETNMPIRKQTYLYDINNLVGEIGGSLGLFLGVSCITLFDYIGHCISSIRHWGIFR